MAVKNAYDELIRTALKLVEKQLVARTWGNLSLRLSESGFLITPSGIPYENLRAEDLVEVDLETLAWSGTLKPSSEKGLHAMIYRERPRATAVIHTHQMWASALAAARQGIDSQGAAEAIPCARYALPTTKALTRAVREVINGSKADTIILANHGALVCADSCEAALDLAEILEARARKAILDACAQKTAHDIPSEAALAEAYIRFGGTS